MRKLTSDRRAMVWGGGGVLAKRYVKYREKAVCLSVRRVHKVVLFHYQKYAVTLPFLQRPRLPASSADTFTELDSVSWRTFRNDIV
jgi:hypothetical protein